MFIVKHKFDKNYIINDYKFRNYLKPYRTVILPSHCEDILIQKRIPYIIKNASKIIIGYKIKTIDGNFTFPVLDRNSWCVRFKLSKQILYETKKKYLYNNTKLPIDIINLILTYLFPLIDF